MPKITRDNVKTAANFIVARSVSSVIVTVLHQNITTATKLQNVQLYIGAYTLGSMLANSAQDHTEKQIDSVADAISKFKEQTKTAQ